MAQQQYEQDYPNGDLQQQHDVAQQRLALASQVLCQANQQYLGAISEMIRIAGEARSGGFELLTHDKTMDEVRVQHAGEVTAQVVQLTIVEGGADEQ